MIAWDNLLQLKVSVYSILLMCAPYGHMTAMFFAEKEVQQPEQLKEQGQADEVLKVNYEQLQLTMKEIEKEMESLGNAFTSESYTPEARDKLAKIQVPVYIMLK